MYFRNVAIILLLSTPALGQATPVPASSPQAPPAAADAKAVTAANVAPNAAVITIKGLCPQGTSANDCATTITRAEFEDITKAVQPQMPQQWQRQFATAYARLLVLSAEARKRGLESTPRAQMMVKLATMNVLQQQLTQALQEQAREIPAGAVEKYYNENKASYARADLLRLYIPASRQPEEASSKDPKAGKPVLDDKTAQEAAGQAFLQEEAAKLRARAVAGEDFDKLQAAAFTAARVKTAPPPTKLDKVSRASLPVNQRTVFDLQPGEVSPLLTEANGMYVYKLVARSTEPLDEVKDDIQSLLQGERFQELMQGVTQAATPELNEAFFGPEPTKPGTRKILPLSPKPSDKK